MKRHLVPAGTAIGGAGLTGVVLYTVAVVPTHVHVYWPYWAFLAAILAGVVLYLAGQERTAAQPRDLDLHPVQGEPGGPHPGHLRLIAGPAAAAGGDSGPVDGGAAAARGGSGLVHDTLSPEHQRLLNKLKGIPEE